MSSSGGKIPEGSKGSIGATGPQGAAGAAGKGVSEYGVTAYSESEEQKVAAPAIKET